MKLRVLAAGLAAVMVAGAHAQMMSGSMEDGSAQNASMNSQDETEQAPVQTNAAKMFAAQSRAAIPGKAPVVKGEALVPLSPRERAVQMLGRFSYGATPGQVDRVLATGGADAWFARQLQPDTISDKELDRRLAQYPTMTMTAGQAADVFPDRGQIEAVKDGRVPYPADPMENAVYEVQVYRRQKEFDPKDANGKLLPKPELTDAEKAARTEKDKATAARLYGDLMALPKEKRMAAIEAMSIEDRIALANGNDLSGQQRALLLDDFNPRERETFLALGGSVSSAGNIRSELSEARVLRDVLSERQLQQVMTNFWFNHFNIYWAKDSDEWYTTSYERDVIRQHALGTFKELLLATAGSPAMMVYLDNYLSIGPDSIANGVNPKNPDSKKGGRGLNENYGREVMELHTVGVNGEYTQADVTALSAILTGWGLQRANQGGGFYFDPTRHEPGTKYWYGYEIKDDGTVRKLAAGEVPKATFGPGMPGFDSAVSSPDSVKQGLAALAILADSPHTAHFISWLLAQYFVADDPPAALVDRLQKTYLASGGDIKTMLRAIVQSPEFNSKQYFRNKVKTPEEFIASAFRSTATTPSNPALLVGQISRMGMPLYNALPPTGYYLTAAQWMSSTALVDRLNFSYNLVTDHIGAGQTFDAPKLLALGLMTETGQVQMGVAAKPVADHVKAKQVGFSDADAKTASAAATPGAQMTLRVLESTVVGAAVSAQTNALINKELEQQPPNANPVDTLKLLTALVLGSPEFQLR